MTPFKKNTRTGITMALWGLCGLVPSLAAAAGESVQVWLTTTSGSSLSKRFNAEANKTFGTQSGTSTTIDITESTTYQTIDGFGGALTDSSAWLIYNSPQRNAIMNDLFSVSAGGGYGMVRLPMGASDFARNNYSYDDTCCDLNGFSINHDTAYIIPLLKQALQLNSELKITAVPWSAPGWMKFNNSFTGGGYLRNDLYGMYADYFVKFLQGYKAQGLSIHSVSMQNEPHNANSTYATMQMEPADQSNFAANNLRPALDNAGFGSVKIFAWDHNWYDGGVPARFPYDTMAYNNGQAQSAIAGVAWHCYEGPEGSFSVQNDFHNAYPNEEIHFTECSGGEWAKDAAANLTWNVRNLVIGPLRNWARSSMYWNIALDPNHGPYTGGCYDCRGMLTVNNSTGTYTKNEDYYSWAHFGKVARAGAVRIGSTSLGNGNIETVAFKNPDGSLALVALNSNASQTLTFKVRWNGQSFDYSLPPRSIASFKWKAGSSGGSTTAYRIVNKSTGKCVDIEGPSTADGAKIHQWACHTGSSQQWTLQPTDGGYYQIVSRYSGKALDVADVSTADGAPVQQWVWSNGSNQQFKTVSLGNGYVRIEARHSGKVLDVTSCTSSGDGTKLQQWTWSNNDCQQFLLEPI
ncbi:glycosyl hydrolase [Cystobacter fuscus]|uniref:Glycosyl hydrolase n=1 Tax=Cystobacter fuscus TaxID=43 RepID=A0A250JG54_9BACT|nr:RICIN domain-containing protein [Cystobacter fuscus]ATB42593.1 glycosyl hydrolase [Cystobacter fuscus]